MDDVSIEVPGGQINVWHRPPDRAADTAVLVHGLSGNSRWWIPVIDHLPAHMGVLALDIRGRGLSVDAPPPFDLTTVAEDIMRGLDHFDVESAIVAGYSMGAWAVALFGVNHPDRVSRLVLIDGGLPLPRDPDDDPKTVIDAIVGPSLRRLEMEFDSEDAFFDTWQTHPALEKHWDEAMRPALRHELSKDDGRFRVRANREAIEVGGRELIIGEEANSATAQLDVPAHLIVVERGTLDQPGGMTPLDIAEDATRANRKLTMQFLPEVNHYTLLLGKGAPAVASAIAPR